MPEVFDRRHLLRGAGLAAAATVAACGSRDERVAGPQTSATPTALQEPAGPLTPEQAVDRLKLGNRAYVEGRGAPPNLSHDRIAALAKGQNPFAVVLSCSDSRAPPEHVFHDGLGELFVIRVAGNTLDQAELGSIEYAVRHFNTPLIVVMGHERCGAVTAAVEYHASPAELPGALHAVVDPILPAVIAAKAANPTDLIEAAVQENVRRVVAALRSSQAVLAPAIAEGKLKVIGARYDLDSGEVDFDIA